ncbi:MAG: hypothetical protein ACTSX7_10230 [Alphaproteobacteria bacterium]
MRWYMLIAIGLTSACAAAGGWTKAGATKELVRADLAQCQSFAREATQRDRRVDQDIRAARRDSPIVVASELRDEVRDFGSAQRTGKLIDQCMRGQGYVRGRLAPETAAKS